MARAPFQVLVMPFQVRAGGSVHVALFRRADTGYWQGIAGGGQEGETPMEAAGREAFEEAGIDATARFFPLDARASIPVVDVCGFLWGPEVLVIPEYSFAALVASGEFVLSSEHSECRWFKHEDAMTAVKWDSNRAAMWELNHRAKHGRLLREEPCEGM